MIRFANHLSSVSGLEKDRHIRAVIRPGCTFDDLAGILDETLAEWKESSQRQDPLDTSRSRYKPGER